MSNDTQFVSQNETQYTPLHHARALAKLGWPVVPLHTVNVDGMCTCREPDCGDHAGKHPRTKHGVHDATTELQQIQNWWAKWPNANVGVATGAVSGLVVIDIDPRNGGDSELQKLFDEHSEFPKTLTVATGGGGNHYYFRVPNFPVKNMTGNHALRPGVEVKSDGGIVVAPPSRHRSGQTYQWIVKPNSTDVAELPAWLGTLLQQGTESGVKATKRDISLDAGSIPDGSRNSTLTQIAGGLRRVGQSERNIYETLRSINMRRCVPPLDDAEVAQIAKSVAHYAAAVETVDKAHNRASTDLGNAERLVDRFGDQIRYCHPWKQWFTWDGTRWIKDNKQTIRRMAYETVRHIYEEVALLEDKDDRKDLAKHARASESDSRIKSMISLAQALPGVPIAPDELDEDNWTLNVANGTLDLRTGTLHPHNAKDHLTKIAPVAYDSSASCPTWDKFLDRIMSGNEGLLKFLQKAVGYALTGDVSEQAIFFLYGNTGKNGKSTFITAIKDVMGDYGQSMQPETLMVRRNAGINNDVARLVGARYVAAVEGDEGQRLSEALVKQMTGGDLITARFLYQEQFDFYPTHKIFFATNHRPLIRGTDDAIWRRIKLIPFEVTIPESERDNKLPEKLRAELPGILRWAVEGCLLWQGEGLGTPPEVQDAVSEYRVEMDVFAKFLDDCCVQIATAEATAAQLYEAYTHWCDDNGERPLSQPRFGVKLSERGFHSKRTATFRMWIGIGLLSSVTPVAATGTRNRKRGEVVDLQGRAQESVTPTKPTPSSASSNDWVEGVI